MNETYITYEEFADLCNKGYTYEGYVIGHGYAFPHVTGGLEYQSEFIVSIPLNMLGSDFLQFPYGMFNVFQYLDTSEEMIKRSYNEEKKEEKTKNIPNESPKTKNNKQQDFNEERYSIPLNNKQQVLLSPWGNNTSNNPFDLSRYSYNNTSSNYSIPSQIPFAVGSLSSGLSYYESLFYDADHYIQKNGEESVWWKQNKKGEAVLKNGKKIPKSANAANKLFRNNALRYGGRFMSGVGLGLTLWDVHQNGWSLRRGTDTFFGVVAFLGPVGACASAGYFIFTIYYDYHLRDWKPSSADLEEAMHTNTD